MDTVDSAQAFPSSDRPLSPWPEAIGLEKTQAARKTPARWAIAILVLGAYLTLHGYQSREGDQAYRLPLLFHRQNPALYADDPFVRAFDTFNPHQGYLALLDWASRPLGLSAALFALFAGTFLVTALAIERLARHAWPDARGGVGWLAVALLLMARAGNIGTVHLFEPILLDRLIALALGWLAIGEAVSGSRSALGPLALGVAAWLHPSLGLQIGFLLGSGWLLWGLAKRWTHVEAGQVAWSLVLLGLSLGIGLVPTIGQGARLFEGRPREEFLLLSANIQSPQHMLPHLWRMPQWLAWGCYPVLALLSLGAVGKVPTGTVVPSHEDRTARAKLIQLLVINFGMLGVAWVAVEVVCEPRITIFQPFRLATVARGLCLVLASGRVLALWQRGDWGGRARATLIVAGLTSDWALVVATGIELVATIGGLLGQRPARLLGLLALGFGLAFLARHDTDAGHFRLALGLGAGSVLSWLSLSCAIGKILPGLRDGRDMSAVGGRPAFLSALAVAWLVPLGALLALGVPALQPLAARCRFAESPTDDIERLALWCREQTPAEARFIGPPGPKAFRLWSRRTLAFNRAASPYHAVGLADWAERFREHVGFQGTTAEFARAYVSNRQELEHGYDRLGDDGLAALARRQGAEYVIAAKSRSSAKENGPLERLHAEGRYAVYRVRIVPAAVQARVVVKSAGTG